MEERRLGPVIGLGTYQTFVDDVPLATDVVSAALDAGTTVFDSSPMYGPAEQSLGEALRDRRDRGIVATKIWAESVEEGRRQYDAQQRFFGTVEIQQVHNLVSWKQQLSWIEEERDAGRIDRIGVTHFDAGAVDGFEDAMRTGRFDCIQIPLNPLDRACERRILPLAEELGLAVIVMRPLGGARDTTLRPGPGQEALRPLHPFGVGDVGAGASEMVPCRSARRPRDPGDVEARKGDRECRRRLRSVVRPGGATPRRTTRRRLTGDGRLPMSPSIPLSSRGDADRSCPGDQEA